VPVAALSSALGGMGLGATRFVIEATDPLDAGKAAIAEIEIARATFCLLNRCFVIASSGK